MVRIPWLARFLNTSRGKLIILLRRGAHTVDELAADLALSDNAVRAHLASLERDGLVTQLGVRPSGGSGGKPAHIYGLTPAAEALFPKAYAPALRGFLDVLAETLPAIDVDQFVREVGRRLAAEVASPVGDRRARLDQAVAVLNDLSGLAEVVEDQQGVTFIRGYSCPLAAIVPSHPEVCHLAEALLTEVVGAPVTEQCDRDEPARCRFVVAGA
jgi:predicted ArsR family transcriptional regulator